MQPILPSETCPLGKPRISHSSRPRMSRWRRPPRSAHLPRRAGEPAPQRARVVSAAPPPAV
eukprot:2156192-Pyramimonas_sp.AAC.1